MAISTPITPIGLLLFSVLPFVLIVPSSILLDFALRYEKTLHRCQIQIWMWLALIMASSIGWQAVLQQNEGSSDGGDGGGDTGQKLAVFFAWGHLTVFFNLSAVLALALQRHSAVASVRSTQNLREILQVLPFLSFCSMVVAGCSLVVPIEKGWRLSLLLFVGASFVLWFVRLFANQKRKTRADMQGMPTTTTANNNKNNNNNSGGLMARFCGIGPVAASGNYDSSFVVSSANQPNGRCWLDKRQWHKWTRTQTMQWFTETLSNGDSGDSTNEDGNDIAIAILSSHCITGDVLDGLVDLSQLVALRVPFGQACKISDSIAELVERYPKPRSRLGGGRARARRAGPQRTSANGGNGGASSICDDDRFRSEFSASEDCLDIYDQKYYNARGSSPDTEPQANLVDEESQPPQHSVSSSAAGAQPQHQCPSDPMGEGGMSEEQQEKLNNLMKERFGLELPKLKATDFLAVQKAYLSKENNGNNHQTKPPSPDGTARPPLFAATTANEYTTDPAFNSNDDYSNKIKAPQQPHQHSQRYSHSNLQPPPSSSNVMPEHLFEGMPPQIREIAKRRPDLIKTMWKQKQEAMQQQQSKEQQAQTNSIEEEVYEDSDDEGDERTSLIDRDSMNQHPVRYKSIGEKSMIPDIV